MSAESKRRKANKVKEQLKKLDAMEAKQKPGAIVNDNKCVKIVAEKFIDKVNPRIEFKIVTIE